MGLVEQTDLWNSLARTSGPRMKLDGFLMSLKLTHSTRMSQRPTYTHTLNCCIDNDIDAVLLFLQVVSNIDHNDSQGNFAVGLRAGYTCSLGSHEPMHHRLPDFASALSF